jgi:hypothetical protein
MKKIIYTVAFCLLTGVSTLAQTNLLLNPSFETVDSEGIPEDWTYMAKNTYSSMEIVSSPVHEGNKSLKNTNTGSGDAYTVQYIQTTPGKEYNLSVWFNLESFGDNRAKPIIFCMYMDEEGNYLNADGSPNISGVFAENYAGFVTIEEPTLAMLGTWQQLTYQTGNVPQNVAYIGIALEIRFASVVYYDDASLTEVGAVVPVKQEQTISGLSDITKPASDADFDLSATASSNTAVATISGSTVHIVGAGTTTITASQAGNDDYNAALDVTATLTVSDETGIDDITVSLPVRVENGRLIVTAVAGRRIEVFSAIGVKQGSTVSAGGETVLPGLPEGTGIDSSQRQFGSKSDSVTVANLPKVFKVGNGFEAFSLKSLRTLKFKGFKIIKENQENHEMPCIQTHLFIGVFVPVHRLRRQGGSVAHARFFYCADIYGRRQRHGFAGGLHAQSA